MCTRPQQFHLSISYHLFDQNLWKHTVELSVKCLNDSVKKCLEKEKISAYGTEWQLLKGNLKKKKRFLAKMFNWPPSRQATLICWLGCCPHLWGVPCDWLATCERAISSGICHLSTPTGMMSKSCHRLSMGHMEWWANEQTMSQTQGFSQANQPSLAPPAQDGAEGLHSARKDGESGS